MMGLIQIRKSSLVLLRKQIQRPTVTSVTSWIFIGGVECVAVIYWVIHHVVGIWSEFFFFLTCFFSDQPKLLHRESAGVSPTTHLPLCCRSNQFQLTSWAAACASLGGNYRFHYASNLQMRCIASITSTNLGAAGLRIICRRLILSERFLPVMGDSCRENWIVRILPNYFFCTFSLKKKKSICTFPPSVEPHQCVCRDCYKLPQVVITAAKPFNSWPVSTAPS